MEYTHSYEILILNNKEYIKRKEHSILFSTNGELMSWIGMKNKTLFVSLADVF